LSPSRGRQSERSPRGSEPHHGHELGFDLACAAIEVQTEQAVDPSVENARKNGRANKLLISVGVSCRRPSAPKPHDHVGPPAHRATLTHCLAARVRLAPSIPDHLDRARPSMPAPARRRVLACRPATVAIVPRRQIAVAALGRLRSGLRRPRRFPTRREAQARQRPSTGAENRRPHVIPCVGLS
jgi:hypothetical protein